MGKKQSKQLVSLRLHLLSPGWGAAVCWWRFLGWWHYYVVGLDFVKEAHATHPWVLWWPLAATVVTNHFCWNSWMCLCCAVSCLIWCLWILTRMKHFQHSHGRNRHSRCHCKPIEGHSQYDRLRWFYGFYSIQESWLSCRPHLLDQKLAGAFFFSPWTNLMCNTPECLGCWGNEGVTWFARMQFRQMCHQTVGSKGPCLSLCSQFLLL